MEQMGAFKLPDLKQKKTTNKIKQKTNNKQKTMLVEVAWVFLLF